MNASEEKKWQEKWRTAEIDKSALLPKNKLYVLDMFPYPSGAGLHVGHVEGYTGTDVYSRYMRMKGKEILHPMGWDAFGLPAENYAIKNKIPPAQSTKNNIQTFTRQIQAMGMMYDWEREIDSSSPEYYRWTQWLFILLWKQGLAYKKKAPANWCPSCQTVLANEQVVEGKCERCESSVEQKDLEQWFFAITKYADRLIEGLEGIDWPRSTKLMQANWIGRKEGININYPLEGSELVVEVFTTRPDTNFGATFIVLAPENELCLKIATKETREQISDYIAKAREKTELERLADGRTKTGVFTGRYAINPLNGRKLPIWVSDFVLATVGTGAVVGVPGHDVRDFEFAKQFGIEVVRVVVGPDGDVGRITTIDQVQEDRGKMINSDFLNGIEISEAIEKMKDFFEAKGWGKRVVNYHLRDWLVSRQRYWGAPIPMIFCEKCGWNPVSEAELPVVLPTDVDFKPTGESPIARSISFQSDVVCSVCGGKGKREVDTMDTFVDSSWYFLRFCDPGNVEKPWSTAEAAKWMPVDVYVGGAEHTVLHLLYSRFFYKVFWDLGLVDKKGGDEPFLKLRHPGTILGEDGRKMSKRWGNVVNPDEVVAKFGADTLRMYEMFMGPFDAVKPWSTSGVEGVHRFINRIERISKLTGFTEGASLDAEIERQMNKLIKKVGNDIEEMSFNTAIATMMETLNVISGLVGRDGQNWAWVWERFSLVLAPFAPHLAEELWAKLGKQFSVHVARWPSYDQRLIEGDKFVVVIQVNGKVRDRMEIQADQADDAKLVEKMAVQSPKVGPHVSGGYKSIYVPRKIINLVTE